MRQNLGKKSWIVPMPVLIIGTFDSEGNPNAMNAAWGSIYDYNQITVSLGSHVSTNNIRAQKAFTISFATLENVEASDYVGIVSKKNEPNKIEKAQLTSVKSEFVNAPIFLEYPLTLECKLVSLDGDDKSGGTLIGEIVNVSVDEKILNNGKIDFSKFHPLIFNCINNKYHVLGEAVADAFKVGAKLK